MSASITSRSWRLLTALAMMATVIVATATPAAPSSLQFSLDVLSGRADTITGGDALLRIHTLTARMTATRVATRRSASGSASR